MHHPYSQQWFADPQIQNFHCGDESWELEVARWIKAPTSEKTDSALFCSENGKSSVWIHTLTTTAEIVGFSSLGKSNWKIEGSKIPVQIIPNFAIVEKFKGCPKVERSRKYSSITFDFLIEEARNRWKLDGVSQLLGLFVHPHNRRAIAFYQRHGFAAFPEAHANGYIQMVRVLSNEAS